MRISGNPVDCVLVALVLIKSAVVVIVATLDP